MKQKKRQKINPIVLEKEIKDATNSYISIINSDNEYSLEIDPDNVYSLSDEQKTFIRSYIEFKNLELAATSTGITLEKAMSYFVSYSSQQEIKRINRAMYQRQFSEKLLSLDEIGGYLSSLIQDINVPLSDRLKPIDKLRVAQMIIDLNLYKLDALNNPEILVVQDIEKELQNLSISSIKQLLYTSEKSKEISENDNLIQQLNINNSLNDDEIAYLKTLNTKDLLIFINTINNKGE